MMALHDARHHLSNTAVGTTESILVGNLYSFITTLHMLFRGHPQHPPVTVHGQLVSLNPFADGLRNLAAGLLERLQDSYEAVMDLVGMANCHLIKADRIASPPFTSPLAMNLTTSMKEDGWSNSTWDAAQSGFPLSGCRKAEELYDQAFFLFDSTASPRGKAAVLLRRGCIHHAKAISAETKDTAAAGELNKAASCFTDAAGLFDGDITNTLLVESHQLLLAISVRQITSLESSHGLPTDVLQAAGDLGRRAHETGNAGAARFMGSLILRFGRWRFTSRRDVQTALVCCRCARAFFLAAEESYLQLQSLIAHGSLLHQSGDHSRAQITIADAWEPEELLKSVLERMQKASKGSGERPALLGLRFNTLQTFDTVASRICQTTGDPALSERWRRERDQLARLGSHRQDLEELFGRLSAVLSPSRSAAAALPPAAAAFRAEDILPQILSLEVTSANSCRPAPQPQDPACLKTSHFKLAALFQLGALGEAKAVLPVALRGYLTGSVVRDWFENLLEAFAPPDAAVQRRKQKFAAADRAISQRMLAQDWEVGARVLSMAVNTCSEFSSPQTIPQDPNSWQTLVFVAMRGNSRALLDYLVAKDNQDPEKLKEWAQCAYEGHLLMGLATQREQGARALSPDEVAKKLGRFQGSVGSREGLQRALSSLEANQLAAGAMLGLAETEPVGDRLFSCIPRDTVLFEISSSRHGLIVFAITHQGIVGEYQSALTSIQLRTNVLNFRKIELLDPLKHTMSDKDVVVFAPSPVMQLFPCTALILEGRPLFLSKIVYHIPSLSLLHHLSRRGAPADPNAERKISVLASSKAAGSDLRPEEAVKHAIPIIGPEAVMVADAFAADAADLASCTTDELRSILGHSDIVYLTTHGFSMAGSPWRCYLDAEPRFRVLDLAALATACARLVVFDCCWTGGGSTNAGNDVIGFTHATLASGVRAYVGGLWQVHEVASLVLMVHFFRGLAAGGSVRGDSNQRVRLGSAWRNAQVAMYNMDRVSAATLIDETLDLWRQKVNRKGLEFLQRFKYSEEFLFSLASKCPFRQPPSPATAPVPV
ncbi:hypothetical protein MAPG_09472 [Magnaporthiopsis poae ATCC 64411]|uniref:CHAT domain-containing protein n=1 Tax=Magnaporthiopsis poae (strain ATCC 64411 / 73-15) TaxID=644358 RepID=A0A0C4EA18_MAGP6|nr:hypothetical protein MAPG_09472 [Magnaporthiopsis poae ATCC 64411]